MMQSDNRLYFDDNCPLCLRTVRFLKQWIGPSRTTFIALSASELEESVASRAYSEMLLILAGTRYFWGFDTYAMLMILSGKRYKFMLIILGRLMLMPGIRHIGGYVYSRIANGRARCANDGSCMVR